MKAANLVKQIRSGRKVFKLLKFVDEYKELVYQIKSIDYRQIYLAFLKVFAPSYLGPDQKVNAKVVCANILLTLTKISSFFYYFLDNLMWIASVGMIPDKVYNRNRWKYWKNVLSLIKNYT